MLRILEPLVYLFFLAAAMYLLFSSPNESTAQPHDYYDIYKAECATERLVKAAERQAEALEGILKALKPQPCHKLIRE